MIATDLLDEADAIIIADAADLLNELDTDALTSL